ncbi:MAG TPA: diaminopimelate decarboxylase [Trueperaceae bacterium]|nr:diaminopimelate decarboxylase [Trueperaceae bacterium]
MKDELLRRIAHRYGTPTYVYDLATITAKHAALAAAFVGADIHYAVKANGLGAILRHTAKLGMGAEALTEGELERVLRAGFAPERIVLGGPGHTAGLVARATQVGVGLVSLDSRGAWEVWRGSRGQARFVVRVNPGFDPHTHEHLATAAAHSKFGMPTEVAVAVAHEVAAAGRLAGFHIHAGSMLADASVAELVVAALEPLYRLFPGLDVVDCGGGFAVPDAPLADFAAPLLDFARRNSARLIIEPGRYVVADAGVLLTTVLHSKSGGPVDHLIADAGMADLLRPALYGARHPVRVLEGTVDPASQPRGVPVDLDGPLCENADRLGRDVSLPLLPAGSVVVVEQAGAYGYAMASNYASSLRPAQVVVKGEDVSLAARREVPSDLWRLEDPGDTPEALLREVLGALAEGSQGLEVLYRAFAESLRAKVGSLEDIARTFTNELYGPLVGDRVARVAGIEVRGDVARAEVTVAAGAPYIMSLARRAYGDRAGAWAITALARDLPGQ